MLNQIASLLQQKGYSPYDINGRTGSFVKEAESEVFLVILNAYQKESRLNDYERLVQGISFNVVNRYKKKVRTLLIIVNRDGIFDEVLTNIAAGLSGVWLLAADTGKIYIYENQPAQFDSGLAEYLENNLFRLHNSSEAGLPFKLTPANISIVVLNIIIYIVVIGINGSIFASYDTSVMLKMGALSYETFIDGGWYELVASLFLHFGISHLFNNMVLLTYVGCELEKRIGSIRYLLIYLLSGIAGNAASLWYYARIGETEIASAGASGAIFGVIGCLIVYLLAGPSGTSDNRNLTARRLMVMALLTIYYGLTTVGIDNAAHIGGFCFGLFGGFLLSKIFSYDKIIKMAEHTGIF
ncbi:MAG: rhomboid family intramembrane serine protease [Lachnospiraceae bacterium]|nr:rhomboid family intramembrane serine protease [Lachnospiraceae bacterium]